MPSKAPYIFLALLVIVLYEVYSIVYYRWQDYQIDTYIRTVQSDTNRLKNSLEEKRAHLAMVQTNAWIDKTIKKTQNRKNPWEEVFLLVAQEDISDEGESSTATGKISTATTGMRPYQKWIYYGFGVNVLEQ